MGDSACDADGATCPGAAFVCRTGADGHLVIELRGEIDVAVSAELAEGLDAVLRAPAGRVVIDLTPVTFFDCAGLWVLCHARRRVLESGGSLRLRGARPLILRLLRITGLSAYFPTEPDGATEN